MALLDDILKGFTKEEDELFKEMLEKLAEDKFQTKPMETIQKAEDLAQGKLTPQELIANILTKLSPSVKVEADSKDLLPDADKMKSFFEKATSEYSSIDPIYLQNLQALYRLGSYGVPIEKINLVNPQATTKYQQILEEAIQRTKELEGPLMDTVQSPPKYEAPSALPALGIISALAGLMGGSKAALPFITVAAAMKYGAKSAYDSAAKASNLVQEGIQEARQLIKERVAYATALHESEKEKIKQLNEILSELNTSAISNSATKLVENINKYDGDLIKALNELDPKSKVLFLSSNMGVNFFNQLSQLARYTKEQTIRLKSEMLLADYKSKLRIQEMLIRQNLADRATVDKVIKDFSLNPFGVFAEDISSLMKNLPRFSSANDLIEFLQNMGIETKDLKSLPQNASDIPALKVIASSSYIFDNLTSTKSMVLFKQLINQEPNPENKEKILEEVLNRALLNIGPIMRINYLNESGKPTFSQDMEKNAYKTISHSILRFLTFFDLPPDVASELADQATKAYLSILTSGTIDIPVKIPKKKQETIIKEEKLPTKPTFPPKLPPQQQTPINKTKEILKKEEESKKESKPSPQSLLEKYLKILKPFANILNEEEEEEEK